MSRTQFNQLGSCEARRLTQLSSTDFIRAAEAFFTPGVRFSKDPKTSRARRLFGALFGWISRVPESVSQRAPDSHPSFSGCFLGFAARSWQWFVENLNWHGCTELGSSRTLQIKPSFVDSFVESKANFWLFLSFVQFQHRLLYFDWY